MKVPNFISVDAYNFNFKSWLKDKALILILADSKF